MCAHNNRHVGQSERVELFGGLQRHQRIGRHLARLGRCNADLIAAANLALPEVCIGVVKHLQGPDGLQRLEARVNHDIDMEDAGSCGLGVVVHAKHPESGSSSSHANTLPWIEIVPGCRRTANHVT